MLNKKTYAVYLSLSLYTVPFQGCRPGPRQESQAAISQTEPSVNKDVVPLQDFNPKSSYVGIEVRTADNWYLQINEDGGGIIGFGASDFDAFPKGTYNFDLLCSQLRANPIAVGEVGVTCNIVHLSKDTESHESFLLNRATVRGWFEIAHNCPRTFGDRTDKIWELKPPLETRKD